MALYIVSEEEQCLQWHIGEPKPNITPVFLQADGDEKAHIEHQFTNIPTAKKRVVIWKEPWATFIYDNLTESN